MALGRIRKTLKIVNIRILLDYLTSNVATRVTRRYRYCCGTQGTKDEEYNGISLIH